MSNSTVADGCMSLQLKIAFIPFTAAGDGRKGYEPGQPYDAIHVGAAAAELPSAVSRR